MTPVRRAAGVYYRFNLAVLNGIKAFIAGHLLATWLLVIAFAVLLVAIGGNSWIWLFIAVCFALGVVRRT